MLECSVRGIFTVEIPKAGGEAGPRWFVGVCRRRMSQSAVDEEFDGQPTQARRAMQTIISNSSQKEATVIA